MEQFISDLSLLLVVAASLAALAVVFKQPIIVAYVLGGVLIGPWGVAWIQDVDLIEGISHLGITLLLFLAGLNLHPQKLIRMFKESTLVTFLTSSGSFILGYLLSIVMGFTSFESFIIGLSMMFSSTILAVKLLPTIELHHKRMGATCISILILQDLLAVAVLAFLRCLATPEGAVVQFVFLSLKLVLFIAVLVVLEIFILRRIMHIVERLQEVLFVLGLAWCFGIASVSYHMGLFFESGAFFAGVVLARHPISRFIAEELKPIRDFFLILFFFTLGAKLNLFIVRDIIVSALIFSAAFMVFKPWAFRLAFEMGGEKKNFAREAGIRLGQLSAFSLLIAVMALDLNLISVHASQFIQLVVIFTIIASSYLVVYQYPTPIGISERLIKD